MKAILFIAVFAVISLPTSAQTNWSVTSPNGQILVTVTLREKAAYPEGGVLFYRVEHGPQNNRSVVIADSPLGLALSGHNPSLAPLEAGPTAEDFRSLRFQSIKSQQPINDSYTMPHGKRRECRNSGNELTIAFTNIIAVKPFSTAFEVDLRAYDNGVAFRYRLPHRKAGESIATEHTSFAVPLHSKVWAAPSDKPTMYAPAYETYYENGIDAGTPASIGFGWSFPLLFHTPKARWALITEANVSPDYCGSRLSNDPTQGVYRVTFPDPAEGHGQGSSMPASLRAGDWEMPWRVIVVGDSLAPIVESTLVTDLAAPARVQDTSWIRPGRVAWSWWSDPPSPQDGAKQKKFVDLAAEMGWEYVLVDANWDIMDNGNIHDVLRHAKEKNVGVLLWYNSGGAHNSVTEKPRDTLTYKEVRRHELNLLKQWGVKGIKVDFFQSDKQQLMGLYHGILEDAAASHIMINFHGCTLPRGWERTWPHLMSMEAVRGEECYIFDEKYPERAPVQNTILPFTRNAVGPMDYTPVTFSNNRYARRTTAAHELALSVLFETGWLHFADKAEEYLSLSTEVKDFLRHVPVTWDDTRFVAGEPGQFVVLARRHGDIWYLAGINGRETPRTEDIRLNCLPAGEYSITRISDGADGARSFAIAKLSLSADHEFSAEFRPYGGFVATLKRK